MNYFKDCWEGKESPLRAFWLLFVFGSLVVTSLVFLLFWWFVPSITSDPLVAITYLNLSNALTTPYILYCTIAIWRCAKTAGKNAYYIKGLLVFSLILSIMSVISVLTPTQ